jgi:hypothetical protein
MRTLIVSNSVLNVQQRLAAKYVAEADHKRNRPLHHSPLFWFGVILFTLAIGYYLFS